MSHYKILYPSVQKCRSETEICNIFERHMKILLDQKRLMINDINEWENNLIRQIKDYVNKQKSLLEQQWKTQLDDLNMRRQEFLDTAFIYEKKQNREEVRLLLEQCQNLRLQLGTFDYPEQPIPFIQLQKVKLIEEIKQDVFSTQKPKINEYNKNLQMHTYSRSTPPSSNQLTQPLLHASRHDIYISGNDKRDLNATNIDDMVDKCPACLMIFPLTMGTNERSQHVNQHFGDS